MKKRRLSLLLALVMALCSVLPGVTAFAASKTPVWDKYEASGTHTVASLTFKVSGNDFTYKVWYPKDIKKMNACPVLLYCNGTGSSYKKAKGTVKFLKIAASQGYICVNNTDEQCGKGTSMDAGFTKLMKLNKTKTSVLYGKVDLDRVVLAGHSQGATCTINMANPQKYGNAKYYKAIYAASLPNANLAASVLQKCPYDSTKVTTPTMLIAGTGFTDADSICPLDISLKPNYKNIKADCVMARMKDVEHTDSMEVTYPYMLAWFDYKLNGNQTAAKAFVGDSPELKTNKKWQNFKSKIVVQKPVLNAAKAGTKCFTASWQAAPEAKGYQLQYSTDKSFKTGVKTIKITNASKLSRKVTSLKSKKRYFIRIRAYRVVGKETYYSAWSGKKGVTVK